jgi:hypothetical protein
MYRFRWGVEGIKRSEPGVFVEIGRLRGVFIARIVKGTEEIRLVCR